MSAKWAALLGAVASTSNTPATDPQAGAATAAAASTPATAAAAAPVPKPLVFEYEKHVAYFSMHLRSIPQGYEGLVRDDTLALEDAS
jgi:predicted lipid-binding transport protein (Tim44 family)